MLPQWYKFREIDALMIIFIGHSKAQLTQLQYSKAHTSQIFQSSPNLTHQTRFQNSKARLTQLQNIFNFPTPYSYCVPI